MFWPDKLKTCSQAGIGQRPLHTQVLCGKAKQGMKSHYHSSLICIIAYYLLYMIYIQARILSGGRVAHVHVFRAEAKASSIYSSHYGEPSEKGQLRVPSSYYSYHGEGGRCWLQVGLDRWTEGKAKSSSFEAQTLFLDCLLRLRFG